MTFFIQKHGKCLKKFIFKFQWFTINKKKKILIKLHLTNKTLSLNIFYIIWNKINKIY